LFNEVGEPDWVAARLFNESSEPDWLAAWLSVGGQMIVRFSSKGRATKTVRGTTTQEIMDQLDSAGSGAPVIPRTNLRDVLDDVEAKIQSVIAGHRVASGRERYE